MTQDAGDPISVMAGQIDGIRARSAGEQEAHDLCISLVGRHEQRLLPIMGSHVCVCGVGKEKSDDILVAVEGRPEKWGPAMSVGKIYIRAIREQVLGHFEISSEDRVEKQAVTLLVLPIDRATHLQKRAYPRDVSPLYGFQAGILVRNSGGDILA